MIASSVVYLKTADVFAAGSADPAMTKGKETVLSRRLSRRRPQTTTLHRCLAIHLFAAERRSALD